MIESLVHPGGDGAVVEQRCKNGVHGGEQRRLAADVEKRFLLSRERCLRQVFGRCRGAYGNRDPGTGIHALPGRAHLRFEPLRKRRLHDPAADRSAGRSQIFDVIHVEGRERRSDARVERALRQEVAIGRGGGGKATRYAYADTRQVAEHLADRGVLASDHLDVAHAELIEGNHIGAHDACTLVSVGRR